MPGDSIFVELLVPVVVLKAVLKIDVDHEAELELVREDIAG